MWLSRCLRAFLGRSRIPSDAEKPSQGLSLREMPAVIYAVGDVHGCLSLYQRLEAEIVVDAEHIVGSKLIVLLGDIIDRGPHSAGMIDHLLKAPPKGFERLTLLGNHEDMMLRFFEAPADHRAWLTFGGRETLMSYGIQPDTNRSWDMPPRELRFLIQSHVPQRHVQFLRELPLYLSLDDYFLVHGGIDVRRPLEDQTRHDLIWTRFEPDDQATACSKTVVHGHTPVEVAKQVGRRISVDTGAFFSGTLSAVKQRPDGIPQFMAVSN